VKNLFVSPDRFPEITGDFPFFVQEDVPDSPIAAHAAANSGTGRAVRALLHLLRGFEHARCR
jgi:hypothetical protein